MVASAISRAKRAPRDQALKKVVQNYTSKRSVFATNYDPRLHPVTSIIAKHWRFMISRDKIVAEIFKIPSLKAYRRQPNITLSHSHGGYGQRTIPSKRFKKQKTYQ